MKIEICENTFWAFVTLILSLAIVVMVLGVTDGYNRRAVAAFAAGYEQGTLPGSQGTAWVKPRSTMNLERKP